MISTFTVLPYLESGDIALLCLPLSSNKTIFISATIKCIVWYFPLFYSIYLSLETITFGNRIASKK